MVFNLGIAKGLLQVFKESGINTHGMKLEDIYENNLQVTKILKMKTLELSITLINEATVVCYFRNFTAK